MLAGLCHMSCTVLSSPTICCDVIRLTQSSMLNTSSNCSHLPFGAKFWGYFPSRQKCRIMSLVEVVLCELIMSFSSFLGTHTHRRTEVSEIVLEKKPQIDYNLADNGRTKSDFHPDLVQERRKKGMGNNDEPRLLSPSIGMKCSTCLCHVFGSVYFEL